MNSLRWIGVALFAACMSAGGFLIANRGERPILHEGKVRRIILFVGDGMGDSEITLARNYALGAAGRLAMDTLPFTGVVTTHSIDEQDPRRPNYVTDSAAAGTAWATGRKTSNGRISTAPGSDDDMKTILELAQDAGWRTGDVTTAELTDATPAVLAAHVRHRSCQGPADMASCPSDRKDAGGLGSIAEQMLDHRVNVLMGGGLGRFEQQTGEGIPLLQTASARHYRVVRDGRELSSVLAGKPFLGLFAAGALSLEWAGLEARPYPSNARSPQTCQTDRRLANEPSLPEMTAKAIELLDGAVASGSGFFLQVEGASIDKQAHAANPCAQIGETLAFDRAVRVGIDYARAHPDTLLIVTADHAHASQIVGQQTDTHHAGGLLSVLWTADRSALTVLYGTNASGRLQDHTGTQVRVAAIGQLASQISGVHDQTDLYWLMAKALGARSAGEAQVLKTPPR